MHHRGARALAMSPWPARRRRGVQPRDLLLRGRPVLAALLRAVVFPIVGALVLAPRLPVGVVVGIELVGSVVVAVLTHAPKSTRVPPRRSSSSPTGTSSTPGARARPRAATARRATRGCAPVPFGARLRPVVGRAEEPEGGPSAHRVVWREAGGYCRECSERARPPAVPGAGQGAATRDWLKVVLATIVTGVVVGAAVALLAELFCDSPTVLVGVLAGVASGSRCFSSRAPSCPCPRARGTTAPQASCAAPRQPIELPLELGSAD